ncbi:oligosaccharide flippase family protein [Periweissella ghanensis]|nr:oligosaccharide flippase family protein [Periweissella ghanensis]
MGTKVIGFLMVPFYTYFLTQGQFGIVDLISTTVAMLTPVVTLSVFDAIFRFTMDKNFSNKILFSNGLVITVIGSIVTLLGGIIAQIVGYQYGFLLAILLILSVTSSFLQYFVRGIGYVKLFAVTGIVGTSLSAILNIMFIWYFKLGINGYLYGMAGAQLGTLILIVAVVKPWQYIDFGLVSKTNAMMLLRYSVPMIPNAFAWWFTNDANRFFILFFLGASANGIYAVANKIPSILTIFFTVFNQAWQISAVDEYESQSNSTFYSMIFNNLIHFSFLGMAGLLLILKPLMHVLVAPNFYSAWEFVPFLMLAMIFSNLSGFLGSTYIAAKMTTKLFSTTIYGMLTNIAFNAVLIPLIGLNGAGLGSALGFLAVMIIRLKQTKAFVTINVKWVPLTIHLVITALMYATLHLQNQMLMFTLLIMFFIITLALAGKDVVVFLKQRKAAK